MLQKDRKCTAKKLAAMPCGINFKLIVELISLRGCVHAKVLHEHGNCKKKVELSIWVIQINDCEVQCSALKITSCEDFI